MKRRDKNNIIKEKMLENKNIINILLIIILSIIIIGLIVFSVKKQIDYNNNGEKNLPFKISEATILSKFKIERKEEEITDKAVISMVDDVLLKYSSEDAHNNIKKITYKDINISNIKNTEKYSLVTINIGKDKNQNNNNNNLDKTIVDKSENETGENQKSSDSDTDLLKNIDKKIENNTISFITNSDKKNQKENESSTFFRIMYDEKREKVIAKEDLIKYNELSKEENLEMYKDIQINFKIEIEMEDRKNI